MKMKEIGTGGDRKPPSRVVELNEQGYKTSFIANQYGLSPEWVQKCCRVSTTMQKSNHVTSTNLKPDVIQNNR